jgi:predicted enzyme related to lactoylglutathione lyase
LYLVVPDVEAERRAIEAAGARVIGAPRDTEYEMRELEIEDPDGHRICLGQTLSS